MAACATCGGCCKTRPPTPCSTSTGAALDLNAALELRREPVPYPIYRVAGNCDVNYSEPSEGLAPFGGVLFFYTHGHHYGVKMGSERLAECAGERGADG